MNKWIDFIFIVFTSTIFWENLQKFLAYSKSRMNMKKRGFIAECQMKTTHSPCEYDSVAAVTMHPSIWTTRTCRGRDAFTGREEEQKKQRKKDRRKINRWDEQCFKWLCVHRMNLEHVCLSVCVCASACVSKCKCAGGGFDFSNVFVGCGLWK